MYACILWCFFFLFFCSFACLQCTEIFLSFILPVEAESKPHCCCCCKDVDLCQCLWSILSREAQWTKTQMALQYGPSGNQVPWSIASTFVGGVCLPMLSTDALQSTSRRHLLICLVCLFFLIRIGDTISTVTFHQHGSQTKPSKVMEDIFVSAILYTYLQSQV